MKDIRIGLNRLFFIALFGAILGGVIPIIAPAEPGMSMFTLFHEKLEVAEFWLTICLSESLIVGVPVGVLNAIAASVFPELDVRFTLLWPLQIAIIGGLGVAILGGLIMALIGYSPNPKF